MSHTCTLLKDAVQQLYDLCKSQPLLGRSPRCVCRALAPDNCPAASSTARRIQQMYLGGCSCASHVHVGEHNAVNDMLGTPQSFSELLSIVLISAISGVRPTPPLYSRLKALVSGAEYDYVRSACDFGQHTQQPCKAAALNKFLDAPAATIDLYKVIDATQYKHLEKINYISLPTARRRQPTASTA
eukprot:2602324-Amphidinium_carterae.5